MQLGPPRDLDRPLGAIRMEDIVSDGIERLEKESSGGLLSKTHHYDHALTIPLVSGWVSHIFVKSCKSTHTFPHAQAKKLRYSSILKSNYNLGMSCW